MEWQAIGENIREYLHGVALMVGGLGVVVVLFAFLNWTVGGIALLGRRRLVLRRSWLFIIMRWLGLTIWLATLPYAVPREISDLREPIQLFFTLTNLAGAVVMLVGTARKPFRERFIATPKSAQPSELR